MKIFKAFIFANALSVNANAINHREKRFISDALQGLGSGIVNLGQALEQNWGQVIGSSIQEVVDEVGTWLKSPSSLIYHFSDFGSIHTSPAIASNS